MGEVTSIAWTDHTFNPWVGCARVSPGCDNCYAESGARRLGAQHGLKLWQGDHFFTGETYWKQPLAWARAAKRDGVRRRVFCASMADVFEDHPELALTRTRLTILIENTPELDWLLLTKRPENMRRLASACWADKWPANVWAGTTCEDQERADLRIPWLIEVPASVRFVSYEPALGPVDLENIHPYYLKRLKETEHSPIIRLDCLRGHVKGPDDMLDEKINWVIVGGESGPRARMFDLEWARDIVRQCRSAAVPAFVKQMGANAIDTAHGLGPVELKDRKGGDMSEWPEDLRIREFPAPVEARR